MKYSIFTLFCLLTAQAHIITCMTMIEQVVDFEKSKQLGKEQAAFFEKLRLPKKLPERQKAPAKQFFKLIPKDIWHIIISYLAANDRAILSLAQYVPLSNEIAQKISYQLLLKCVEKCPDISKTIEQMPLFQRDEIAATRQLLLDTLNTILSQELEHFIAHGPTKRNYIGKRGSRLRVLDQRLNLCIKNDFVIDTALARSQLANFHKKEILRLMRYYNFFMCLSEHCCSQIEETTKQLKYAAVICGPVVFVFALLYSAVSIYSGEKYINAGTIVCLFQFACLLVTAGLGYLIGPDIVNNRKIKVLADHIERFIWIRINVANIRDKQQAMLDLCDVMKKYLVRPMKAYLDRGT